MYSNALGSEHLLQTLLDSCSQRTLILEETAKRLRLRQVGLDTLAFSTIAGIQNEKDYKLIELPIYKDKEKLIIKAVCINYLPEKVWTPGLQEVTKRLSKEFKLAKNDVDKDKSIKLELLIGVDYYYEIANHAQAINKKESLYLVPTYFGYSTKRKLSAEDKTRKETTCKVVSVLNICELPSITCDRETTKLWDLNAIEINEAENLIEIDPIHKKFMKSIVFNVGHYVVGLP